MLPWPWDMIIIATKTWFHSWKKRRWTRWISIILRFSKHIDIRPCVIQFLIVRIWLAIFIATSIRIGLGDDLCTQTCYTILQYEMLLDDEKDYLKLVDCTCRRQEIKNHLNGFKNKLSFCLMYDNFGIACHEFCYTFHEFWWKKSICHCTDKTW